MNKTQLRNNNIAGHTYLEHSPSLKSQHSSMRILLTSTLRMAFYPDVLPFPIFRLSSPSPSFHNCVRTAARRLCGSSHFRHRHFGQSPWSAWRRKVNADLVWKSSLKRFFSLSLFRNAFIIFVSHSYTFVFVRHLSYLCRIHIRLFWFYYMMDKIPFDIPLAIAMFFTLFRQVSH